MRPTVARLAFDLVALRRRSRERARAAVASLFTVAAAFCAAAPSAHAGEAIVVEQEVTPSPAHSTPPSPAGGAPAAGSKPSPEPPGSILLSNEETYTAWAHALVPAPIYAHPDKRARRIDHIHIETEDGFPEVYMLLFSYTDAQGEEWTKLRIPGRPNGRTGWVLREALEDFHHTRWLVVISLRRRLLTAYYDDKVRFRAPVGVGKPSTPTPPGRFWIRERFKLASRSSPYWPYAIGTSDYSTLTDWPGGGVVGIHGDFGEPQKIPGDPSHGCVRMRDGDLAWLAPRLTLGTPVRIE